MSDSSNEAPEVPQHFELRTNAPPVPLLHRMTNGILLYSFQFMVQGPARWFEKTSFYFQPPPYMPDIVKTYPSHEGWPIR